MKRKIVSLYPDAEMKEKLEQLSEKHRRSLNQQILIMLDDWFRIIGNLNELGGELSAEAIENLMRDLPSVRREPIRASAVQKKRDRDFALA